MRHFLLPGPVTALPVGVGVATARAGLIAAAGGTNRTAARLLGTLRSAVALAAITVAADEYGGAAAGAQVASSGKVHWQWRPMANDGDVRFVKYYAGNVAPEGLRGAASGLTWRLVSVSRLHFHRRVDFLPHRRCRRYRVALHAISALPA